MSKPRKFHGTANPAYTAAMQGLRRSNAAGPHPLAHNKGTRAAQRAKALTDQDRDRDRVRM
jgi:hypothetical protein